jgi:competence protein ComEC
VSIRRAYGRELESVRHPLPSAAVAGLAMIVAIVCWLPDRRLSSPANLLLLPVAAGVVAIGWQRDRWRHRVLVVVVLTAALAGVRAESAWSGLHPRHLGQFDGWAEVVGDPQPFRSSTRVVVEAAGERFEYWARGRARRLRVAEWVDGDRLLIRATREALEPGRQLRVASQHVVGELRLDWVAEVVPGGPLDRASNRVRAVLRRGSLALPSADAALFRGLVLGDDSDQPPEMIERFRASGLSHLTAVSGQNVGFLLAAAGPLIRRLRPAARWTATIGLIGWFVAMTRFEPSIVRAGAMAALSATAFAMGRERHPSRILWLAVIGLLLIDPLLSRSVGFWLSAGATAGVTTVGPWLSDRLHRLGLLATPIGITLGAQVGVLLPAVIVFGSVPLVSVPANLLATPVAGLVMLYGLPAGLASGALPSSSPLVMLPCRIGVRWVDLVARLGQQLEPGGRVSWAGWLVVIGVVGVLVAGSTGKNRSDHGCAPPDR